MKKYIRELKKFICRHQIEVVVGFIFFITCIVLACALKRWLLLLLFIPILLIIIFNDYLIKLFKRLFKIKEKEKDNIDLDVLMNEEVKEVKDILINEEIKEVKDVLIDGSDKMKKKKKSKKVSKNTTNSSKKKVITKIFKFILIFILVGIILAFIGALCFWGYIAKNAPKFNEDNLYKKESSILYDKNGEIFAKLGSEFREKITYDELPEVLVNAIVATEDSRFFEHNGFDLPRFVKASVGQVAKKLLGVGANAGGASTLTMQISKNAFTSSESEGVEGIIRKFTDIYVSINEIEKNYTKEQIIEFYVNSYCLGGNIYGVEQASLSYFGKHAKDLNLSEAAIIAGLFQAPNYYNPLKNPENAAVRRKIVLRLMVRHGYITQEEADIANSIPVESLTTTSHNITGNEYQGFIDTVVSEVKADTGLNPYTTAMEIYTTMDKSKQDIVNRAMKGETFAWENEYVNGGISVLETKTGAIAAVGTGRDTSGIGLLNHATFENQTRRQIGSTAKPLYDYGPAIEFNNASPADYVGDERYSYTNGPEIANWDGLYYQLMTYRSALAGSRNVPALKVFQTVNNANILQFVTNLGLSPETSNGYIHEAHSIGGYNGESPVAMSAAYAAFGNGGVYNEPHSYTKLIYRDTKKEVVKEYETRTAMKESTAYIVFDMLVTTSQEAMLGYKDINGWRYGAKTGTTNFTSETKAANGLAEDAINDLWCDAVTDEYTISVWYGYDKINRDYYTHFGNSSHIILLRTIASQVWTRSAQIEQPDSVISVTVEANAYGELKLPSKYTPADQVITDLFVKGSEPTEVSDKFKKLDNPTNLKSSYSNGNVTLTWAKIKTPNWLDKDYISKLYSKKFVTPDHKQVVIDSQYNYFANVLGGVSYDIYKKENDKLTLVGTTSDNKYTVKITSTAKNITYLVKTSWLNNETMDSDGVSTTVEFNGASAILSAELVGANNVEIEKGTAYLNGIKVFLNDNDVTSSSSIRYSILNSSNVEVGTSLNAIKNLDVGSYELKYTATYNGNTASVIRNIKIIEKTSN